MSLFGASTPEPLAARMRPRTLDEVVGQRHVVGPGRLLRRAIEGDQLSSVLFFGPPGTGKTTLARVIAATTRARFAAINAVLGGVKEIREAVAEAQEARQLRGQRTLLFVDEVHRFNKAQQDALLPWVEDGTVVLIGATTENPYFEVNAALVSRSRLFRLEPIGVDDLKLLLRRAISDPERGYGRKKVVFDDDAADHLCDVANGDARTLLNAIELAVETTPPGPDGVVHVTLGVAEESIQRRAVLYDREGDAHFDTISAFIKSVRGSDPDAALYWLARMVHAGEDPRFVLRRLLILASEDVGLADPAALPVVLACAQAFDRMGMPEGRYPLAQATLYLSLAPKSNSTMGFFDALAALEGERTGDVPMHLKDASRDAKGMGHGQGYLYPHAYRDHWVAQQYLPQTLQGRVFYQPSDQGWEGRARESVDRRREEQLAAMVEPGPNEPLSWSPTDAGAERWLARALGHHGDRLAKVRELLFEHAALERHHLVADLNAGTGLLTFEAVRRVPEGHVWALAGDAQQAAALADPASRLPELRRPAVVVGGAAELVGRAEAERVRFDRLIGRDVLGGPEGAAAWADALGRLLAPGGRIVLVESVPRWARRLADALPDGALPAALLERFRAAEEAIYADPSEPRTAWDDAALVAALAPIGRVTARPVRLDGELAVTRVMADRWFAPTAGSYGQRLRARLGEDVAAVESAVRSALVGRTVPWPVRVALIEGSAT